MPFYDYKCKKCEEEFEVFHSINSTEQRFCPKCGSTAKKLISAPPIIFKGSGFYTTEYRDEDYTKDAKKDKEQAAAKSEPAAKTDSTSTKTETPPAKTSESTAPSSQTPAQAS